MTAEMGRGPAAAMRFPPRAFELEARRNREADEGPGTTLVFVDIGGWDTHVGEGRLHRLSGGTGWMNWGRGLNAYSLENG